MEDAVIKCMTCLTEGQKQTDECDNASVPAGACAAASIEQQQWTTGRRDVAASFITGADPAAFMSSSTLVGFLKLFILKLFLLLPPPALILCF